MSNRLINAGFQEYLGLINAENHRMGKVVRDHGESSPKCTLVKGLLSPAQSLCDEDMAGNGMGSAWMGAWQHQEPALSVVTISSEHNTATKNPQQCRGQLGKQGQLVVRSLFWCHSGVPKWIESTEGINTEQATETMKSAPPPAPQLSPAEPSEV